MRGEYPRPDFVRQQWLSLNGTWDFFLEDEKLAITVPFVCQSQKSGIGRRIKTDYMVYERTFSLPTDWQEKVVRLHFGAVDYACTVFVNDSAVTHHIGGNSSFYCDIESFLVPGEQKLRVEVYDPLEDETIPRGKQFWKSKNEFIWYTPSSGIWQSVWLESLDQSHFELIHFTPDLDRGMVDVDFTLSEKAVLPCTATFAVSFSEEVVAEVSLVCHQRSQKITIDVFGNRALEGGFHFTGRYWTPENPLLYRVKASLSRGEKSLDQVETYFGMRKVHVENGRFYLNNLPYYNKLILDQGYWEESLITAPCDEEFIEDIKKFKAMGFNGCRKHEKVEDPRFLYWADHLGFLVWEGMASFWSYTKEGATNFAREWQDIIKRDYNHPSIVVWGMLNESWGVPRIYDDKQQQDFSQMLYYLAYSLDQSRLVIANDGWEQTQTDIFALHSYKHGQKGDKAQQILFAEGLQDLDKVHQLVERLPLAKGYEYQGQPFMLTECGGISMSSVNSENWGYTVSETEEDFLAAYETLMEAIYQSDKLCGFCYTQATDIEQETNGLLTTNHQFKFSPEKIRAINDRKKINNL